MFSRRRFFALVAALPALPFHKRKPIAESPAFVIAGNGNTFRNCRFVVDPRGDEFNHFDFTGMETTNRSLPDSAPT